MESPAPSPQHTTHTLQNDMHSRLEMYASRLAQVECGTRSNSTPESDDEHQIPNQFNQSLSSNGPKSPNNEVEEREELESILRDLEEENATLQAEYDRLKNKQTPTTTPDDAQTTPTQGTGQGQVKINFVYYFSIMNLNIFFNCLGYDGGSEAIAST